MSLAIGVVPIRDGSPGVCIIVDGPAHNQPDRRDEDRRGREALQDRGFRIVAITAGRPIGDQIADHPDVFSPDPASSGVSLLRIACRSAPAGPGWRFRISADEEAGPCLSRAMRLP